VRGRGLWLAAVLTAPLAAQVEAAAREAGYLVNAVQPDAIRLAPPLILEAGQAAAFRTALPAMLDAAGGPDGAAAAPQSAAATLDGASAPRQSAAVTHQGAR
jgi:acetylornithine/N-succinyldiaminopimelate aminotransferase